MSKRCASRCSRFDIPRDCFCELQYFGNQLGEDVRGQGIVTTWGGMGTQKNLGLPESV